MEYELTPYNVVSLRLLKSHEYLSRNRQYFLSHDVTVLPCQFINRIGELRSSSLHGDFITNYVRELEMAGEAEVFAYSMGDQINAYSPMVIAEKLKGGVEFPISPRP